MQGDGHAAAVTRHLRRLASLAESSTSLASDVAEITQVVISTLLNGNKLMFCGNGGSAADAQHLATEYVVRLGRAGRPLAAIALTTDTSLLTAASNDLGFEQVFARQVEALGKAGDILFLHSTSGQSANLLRAAISARRIGVTTVALLARGGGALRSEVDHSLVVGTEEGAHAQEIQLAIGHAICELVETELRQGEDA